MPWPPTAVTEELRNDVALHCGSRSAENSSPSQTPERDMVAAAIVEHIRRRNWRVQRGPPWGGLAELGGAVG